MWWALSHPSLFLLTSCQVLQPFVPQLGPAMGEPFPGRQRAVEGGVYQHSLRGGGSSVLEGCWQQAAFQKARVFGQGRLKCRCYIIYTNLGLLEKSNFRYKGELLWGT